MDLARDTPVRLVPYPFARLNGALLLEISDKEALVCPPPGARPQVLAQLCPALRGPHSCGRRTGSLPRESSDREALVSLRRGARPQVLAELRRVLGVPVRV